VLRAVLDANVLASAFIRPHGHSGQILRALVERNAFELVLSSAILSEFNRVLFYPRLRKELHCSDEEIALRVAALGLLSDFAEGNIPLKAAKDDPDDDKDLAAAIIGRAGFVVSGDHHLLDWGEFQGLRIVKPKRFLEILSTPLENLP
jgi:putative PIN family toxin of toxin-antitoxin system